MPRPRPIIVPGGAGGDSSFTDVKTKIDIGPLVQFFKRKKAADAKQAERNAMLKLADDLGMDSSLVDIPDLFKTLASKRLAKRANSGDITDLGQSRIDMGLIPTKEEEIVGEPEAVGMSTVFGDEPLVRQELTGVYEDNPILSAKAAGNLTSTDLTYLSKAQDEGLKRVSLDTEEIALSEYGKPFRDLTKAQQKNVRAIKKQFGIDITAGKESAKIDVTKEQKPLSSSELEGFRVPDTLAKFPAGTTMADVEKAGGVSVTNKQIDELNSLDEVSVIVEAVDQLSTQLITAENALDAAKQGVSLKGGALLQTNPTARAYSDQKAQFTGVISRALGGEKGVLTDRDIDRVVKGMPGFGDRKAVRDFKIGTIKLLIEVSTESKRRKIMGGEPTLDQKKRIKKLVNDLTAESPRKGKTKSPLKKLGEPGKGKKQRINIEGIRNEVQSIDAELAEINRKLGIE